MSDPIGTIKYSAEFRARVCDLAASGLSHAEIGRAVGIPHGCVSSVLYRARNGYKYKRETPKADRPKLGPYHMARAVDLKPAKHPYAPDASCPDFAHDDMHCEAVMALGGFPVLIFRRAA